MKQLYLVLLFVAFPAFSNAQNDNLASAYTCMRLGDFTCAVKQFEEHANSGNSEAQFQLGKLYLSGRGTPTNKSKAKHWLQLAAESGVAGAQYSLAMLLVDEDKQEQATPWMKKAADLNYRLAKQYLSSKNTDNTVQVSQKNRQLQWNRAAIGCDIKSVNKGLRAGININETDDANRTALYYLVECDDANAIVSMLKHGANPNISDNYGETPLTLAVRKSNEQVTRLLIEGGANPKKGLGSRGNLLHIAVSQKSKAITKILLNSKVAHSKENGAGHTPLDLASNLQLEEIEDILANAGARHGRTWSKTIKPSGKQTLSYLEQERSISPESIWQSAVQAIKHDQADVLVALLNNYSDQLLAEEDHKLRTLLIYAVEVSSSKSITTLIENGADLNQANEEGTTALMTAAQLGDSESVTQLLSYDADVRKKDKLGRDAAHLALLAQHDETAFQILKNGKLRHEQTDDGQSYLMLAVRGNAPLSFGWLIQHQLHINLRDNKLRSALWFAANSCDTQSFEKLLAKGADIALVDKRGYSALHVAVSKNCKVIVEYMMPLVVDLNLASKTGNTALMLASRMGHKEIALLLLSHGADVSIQNRKGDTALLLSVRRDDSLKLMGQLLEGGSDVYRRNELGESAFSIAEKYNPDAFELIREKSKFSLFGR